ncbi:UDP-N-acetylmuramoyl-L-alanyl-D-glutamate--2,6-diaminopimelate ligase [Virgibacillus phasianinus]|uniref:UDP-N-acetylmuramyl-tripeptide synthetase n=1 Tax=Virgibacillus phasianinus TaxID=2017483 RepID=A0A220U1Y7_9BACI|nr:UDP-N-acetylmuramoyl-L-alanyl-D-glutamate--2,6-diaminopimelate ligase [Virgibacillus phasianinus]ASK61946.1 UDP-N-acetylmuramoyl-L-alanyl-D-glutamate--2,6-diaminopimelate ligase [Virgibacillus phasianinus]
MLLSSVVQGLEWNNIEGNLDRKVEAIAYDSRDVVNDSLFVAISGFAVDGHQFIANAVEQGATTIILEKETPVRGDVTVIKVENSRDALARISANFYGNPTEKLNLVGITGTNGKTSTTYFIKSIFEQAKRSTGLIGTTGTMIGDQHIKNKNTTPESLNLQQFFSKMADTQTDNCIMEVSSHALNLRRVAYSDFNIGIFTNLSPDHLELHKDMDEYFEAKAMLFDLTKECNIVNVDDEYGRRLIQRVKDYGTVLLTYGINQKADIYPTNIRYSFDGTTYTVNTPSGSAEITVNLPGDIYVYNSLAAIACAYASDISLAEIQQGILKVTGIKGRMETVYKEQDYKVIVDFSHTEAALEKALNTLRPFVKGKLVLVFGVYADESDQGKEKRVGMSHTASKYADFSVVTSDNPKKHDQMLIIDEIAAAMDSFNGQYKAIPDREEAINYAIEASDKDDTILIAGKGHETTQIIGDQELPFNEREIVLKALKRKKQIVRS